MYWMVGNKGLDWKRGPEGLVVEDQVDSLQPGGVVLGGIEHFVDLVGNLYEDESDEDVVDRVMRKLLEIHVLELDVDVDQEVVGVKQEEKVLQQKFGDQGIRILVLKQVALRHQELDSVFVFENAEDDVDWGDYHAYPQQQRLFPVVLISVYLIFPLLDQNADQDLEHHEGENC